MAFAVSGSVTITMADGTTLDSFVNVTNEALASLQKQLSALQASSVTTSGATTSGATTSGATTSGILNTEGLSLSIPPNTFTFSNIVPGNSNNTIAIVSVHNSKMQYPTWSIVRSNIPLTIDYAGYVHAQSAPGSGPITFTVQCVDTVGRSTAVASFSIPVVQVGLQQPVRSDPSYSLLPSTGIINSSPFLSDSNSLVGFNILNATSSDIASGFVQFVQPFPQGEVVSGTNLVLLSGASSIQIDPLNQHADGSLRNAIITAQYPPIPSNSSLGCLLGAKTYVSGASIDLLKSLSAYSLSLDIQFLNNDGTVSGSALTFDIAERMRSDLVSGKASFFREGMLVSEARTIVPINGSLYLNVDISAYANGEIVSDISVRNDIVMGNAGGAVYTTGFITQNGVKVYSWNKLYQCQYQAWFVKVGTSLPSVARVQLDPAFLIKASAIQPYNLSLGINAFTINNYVSIAAKTSDWLTPLAVNGVDTGMPGTGGRPDIGYVPQSAAVALITQDPRVIDYCCAQAEAAGSVPWNFYDMANNHWLSTEDYPDIWMDPSNRGGVGTSGNSQSGGPTQPITNTPQGWEPDQAHQPNLAFVPWLYTARRAYLDQILSQSAWAITGAYGRKMTIPETSTVISQSLWSGQVRGIAWNLRQVSDAAWAAPANTYESSYLPKILSENVAYGIGLQTFLQNQQGNCYGYLAQSHGLNNFAPWEQNYLTPIVALAGARNFNGYSQIASWFARFTVESFLPQSDGPYKGVNWCQNNGASYELFCGPTSTSSNSASASGFAAQTWAELEYWTVVAGQSNGGEIYNSSTGVITSGMPNWGHSAGDYGQLCLASLVWANILNIPSASTAYTWAISAGMPYTAITDFESDPTFSLNR